MIFFVLKLDPLFFAGFNLTEDFERRMCFNSVACALDCLESFCNNSNEYNIEDFEMYVKAEVY